MRRVATLMFISGAVAQLTCPAGTTTGVNGEPCCECPPGFAQPECKTCKPGYLYDDSSGTAICRNGVTDCADSIPYPHGCSGHGTCASLNPPGSGYYGCACQAGWTGQGCQTQVTGAGTGTGGGCHPAGVQLTTQSPLEVTYGEPFNILMWGCDLKPGDSYRIIPADGDCADAVNVECQVTAAGLKDKSESVPADCTSVEVTGSNVINNGDQASLDGLTLGTQTQDNKFKTCRKADGETSFLPVTTHDERGYRDPSFVAVPKATADAYQAAALYESQGGGEWKCCDDLEIRLGNPIDICLPLWVWLLIMLLILLIIALLLWKNHKMGKDIEMERNNRQFEVGADVGDDSALKMDAAKRAGADDDV